MKKYAMIFPTFFYVLTIPTNCSVASPPYWTSDGSHGGGGGGERGEGQAAAVTVRRAEGLDQILIETENRASFDFGVAAAVAAVEIVELPERPKKRFEISTYFRFHRIFPYLFCMLLMMQVGRPPRNISLIGRDIWQNVGGWRILLLLLLLLVKVIVMIVAVLLWRGGRGRIVMGWRWRWWIVRVIGWPWRWRLAMHLHMLT